MNVETIEEAWVDLACTAHGATDVHQSYTAEEIKEKALNLALAVLENAERAAAKMLDKPSKAAYYTATFSGQKASYTVTFHGLREIIAELGKKGVQ